jgi:DNA processing protein
MGQARTSTTGVADGRPRLIDVHAVVEPGPATFTLTGLPHQGLNETRDRVRAASANSGIPLPQRSIRVQLSPPLSAALGTGPDLAIAVAVLAAAGVMSTASIQRYVHIGELGLDGSLRPVRAVAAAVALAVQAGRYDLVVANENVPEAETVPGARVHGAGRLSDVIAVHSPAPAQEAVTPAPGQIPDPHRPGTAPGGMITDERLARAAWSRLAEPTDDQARDLVAALGPVDALSWVLAGHGPGSWQARIAGLDPAAQVQQLTELEGRLLIPGDAEWPPTLADLGAQMPFCLWVRGPLPLAGTTARSVALIGARAASAYGEHVAADLAAGCAAEGITVVSGAAYGIDSAAHRGALAADGATIAVLACGVDRAHPRGHQQLLEQMYRQGLVLSENPLGCPVSRTRFLARDRLIAALGGATVVVEGAHRSGSLRTATQAMRLSRPVGAVPGPITSPLSSACHLLLREGAVCITGPADLSDLVGPSHAERGPEPVAPAPSAGAPVAAATADTGPDPTGQDSRDE